MKYIPILFSTLMVQALLAGRKTMTRRVIKGIEITENEGIFSYSSKKAFGQTNKEDLAHPFLGFGSECPYGKVGDVLWVREMFTIQDKTYKFLADNLDWLGIVKWKPNIHMPKEACRLFLEITNIKVERLQDISEDDAIAEGVEQTFDTQFELNKPSFINYFIPQKKRKHKIVSGVFRYAKDSYETLWQSINGANSWNKNPWVWVIEFKQITKPDNFN